MDSVYSAVRTGADAIYIGAQQFSARASAHNFDKEQLKEVVRYCHLNGTAVHLACNTIVHDDEINHAMKLVEYACEIGIDALIMQDTGLISLTRKSAPDMPIHGSTQLSVHTAAGVENLAKLGLTRVVLSRELSKNEILEIAKRSPVELEVFVHGALCMSVSGQCYFSAMLGSRSGNRGACAQPCRLPFSVKDGTGHDLSLKDLSVIEHLRELEEMGIASAKIEGRMKRPEYVAAAVAACRQSLDEGKVSPELSEKLRAVFSRSGFTDGYYEGKTGVSMFGVRSKEGAADSKVFGSIHEMYKNERRHIPVDFSLTVKEGEASTLTVSDNSGNVFTATGAIPEKAIKTALDSQRCEKSIAKTGGTPFVFHRLECTIDDGLSMPASALNAMRSECLNGLGEMRKQIRPIAFEMCERAETDTHRNRTPKNYRVRFTDCDISDEFLDSKLIYVPVTANDKQLIELMDRGFAIAVEIPRGMFGLEQNIYRHLKRIQALGINEVLANNVGAVEMAKSLGMEIHGGFGLNLANTEALKWAERQGITDTEVSFELTLEQIAKLGGNLPVGIITSGRLPLMLTRNCPAQNDGKGCKHCAEPPTIRDRKGIKFPIQCYGACTEILNSVPLTLADRKSEIRGVDFEVIRFSTENSAQKSETLRLFKQGLTPKNGHTRGLYYRGVE
ncbi:MAG: U32 family peptidase [Clostridia bacterium]|nr:U32 family peptidase [Clostridia bacterium]